MPRSRNDPKPISSQKQYHKVSSSVKKHFIEAETSFKHEYATKSGITTPFGWRNYMIHTLFAFGVPLDIITVRTNVSKSQIYKILNQIEETNHYDQPEPVIVERDAPKQTAVAESISSHLSIGKHLSTVQLAKSIKFAISRAHLFRSIHKAGYSLNLPSKISHPDDPKYCSLRVEYAKKAIGVYSDASNYLCFFDEMPASWASLQRSRLITPKGTTPPDSNNTAYRSQNISIVLFLSRKGLVHWATCLDTIAGTSGTKTTTNAKKKIVQKSQQGFDQIFRAALNSAHGVADPHQTLVFIMDNASIHNDKFLLPVITQFKKKYPSRQVELVRTSPRTPECNPVEHINQLIKSQLRRDLNLNPKLRADEPFNKLLTKRLNQLVVPTLSFDRFVEYSYRYLNGLVKFDGNTELAKHVARMRNSVKSYPWMEGSFVNQITGLRRCTRLAETEKEPLSAVTETQNKNPWPHNSGWFPQ
jgi:hypothetical protein